MDHMTLNPFQATAAGAGAGGPRPECGTSAAALTDLSAEGREGPDHCGLCPRGHLSGQPSPGPAGGRGEKSPLCEGRKDRALRKTVLDLYTLPPYHLWDQRQLRLFCHLS